MSFLANLFGGNSRQINELQTNLTNNYFTRTQTDERINTLVNERGFVTRQVADATYASKAEMTAAIASSAYTKAEIDTLLNDLNTRLRAAMPTSQPASTASTTQVERFTPTVPQPMWLTDVLDKH